MPAMRETHYRSCHLCEAMCGVAIDVEGDRVVGIRGDDADPFSKGHICPKAPAIAELHDDPDRLRGPVRRTGAGFVPVSWAEALDEAAARLHQVQERHGTSAVATYLGNPIVHNHGAALMAPVLVRALHTRNRYSATSVDQLPHQLASYFMLGHQLLLPVPDIDRTRYLLMLGANPLASMGSLMTAPGVKDRLRAIRARGGRVVLVDPRRSETAEVADEHVFIRPGSDVLFLLALLHVTLGQHGPRLGHLVRVVRGAEKIVALVRDFAPERVADATGVPAATTRRLAAELWDADPGVVYGRIGVSQQGFGAACQWLIQTLNVVTGNFDRAGGAMLTRPAIDAVAAAAGVGIGRGSYGRWRSRVRGFPEAGGELPVATMAEDMLEPGAGQIRGLLTIAGNPVLSTPNGAQVDRALAGLEFMVSVDAYVNETTRHAHIILPPVSPLERSHFDVALPVVAVRNNAKWSPAIFPAPDGGRTDWQILLELKRTIEARRGPSLRARLENALLDRLGPDGTVDLLLRAGPYGQLRKGRAGLTLRKLEAAPHGVDLGALEPCLPERLPRRHKRVELAPKPLVREVVRARALLEVPRPEVVLVGRRHLRSNNSWMHNLPKLAAGKNRCTLLVHPDDAARLGLTDGAPARVRSRVGEIQVPVEISDEMMAGVVSLPHGFGHGRPGVQLRVAARAEAAGASVNDLTDELLLDELSGTAAFSGVPVEVRPA
jgi:anaerobic selenocysteine-containing dehydrogenase